MYQDLDHNLSAAQFAARRLPEIKSLWRSFLHPQDSDKPHLDTPEENTNLKELHYSSGGGKISHRHLRRRAGSYRGRKHHRFPTGKTNSELVPSTTCRKAKRKPSLLRHTHSSWQRDTDDYLTSNQNRQWLVTHLWHAKRFHMSPPLYQTFGGFCIPTCHNNRDSKAVIRLLRKDHKTAIQDATYTMGGTAFRLEISRGDFSMGDSSSFSSIQSILQRFCGYEQPSFLEDEAFLSGSKVGYSMIYSVDSYPRGVLGPAMFLLQSSLDVDTPWNHTNPPRVSCSSPWWFLYMWVPPNLHPLLPTMIQSLNLVRESDSQHHPIPFQWIPGQALLRIRGHSSSSMIQSTLGSNIQWKGNSPCPHGVWDANSHSQLSHGTVIYANAYSPQPTTEEPHSMDTGRIDHENQTLILISQCPNPIQEDDPSNNYGCSGWDILCHPTLASELFHTLTVQGGACAIGMKEHAALMMEADPPIPVWPRDYPDTKTGVEFWMGTSMEWNLIQHVLKTTRKGSSLGINQVTKNPTDSKEGGGKTVSLPWDPLLFSEVIHSQHSHGDDTVLLRGHRVEPIYCILRTFYSPPTVSQNTQTTSSIQRRPRRPVRPSNSPLLCPPLSKNQSALIQELCNSFLKTESLESLVRCHVQLQEKGTLSGSNFIYESGCKEDGGNRLVIGFVMSGMFSPSRGREHGVGLLSAPALVHYLSKGDHGILAVQRKSSNRIRYFIRVVVMSTEHDVNRKKALISLLL